MAFIRKLLFITTKHNFIVNVIHIPDTNNSIADALSRLQLVKFQQLAPNAYPVETKILPQAWIT